MQTEEHTTLADLIGNLDSYIDAADLIAKREHLKELSQGFRDLAGYAESKGHAMEARLKGEIEMALRFEHACDVVYARLPEWAKTW